MLTNSFKIMAEDFTACATAGSNTVVTQSSSENSFVLNRPARASEEMTRHAGNAAHHTANCTAATIETKASCLRVFITLGINAILPIHIFSY